MIEKKFESEKVVENGCIEAESYLEWFLLDKNTFWGWEMLEIAWKWVLAANNSQKCVLSTK